MRRCSKCGLLSDDRNDVCVECGIQLDELEYRWWNALNSSYRKENGVLPELDFVGGKNGFNLIQAPPVQHSELAGINVSKVTNIFATGMKSFLKNAGKIMTSGLKIAAGDVAGGIGKFLEGAVDMYATPIKSIKSGYDVSKTVSEFEIATWNLLYFLKNFTPVSIAPRDEYYVGIIDAYSGFKVYPDGTYFEGFFISDKPSVGVEIKPNGERFIGNYENGEKHTGITLYSDGTYYSGTYSNRFRNGEGGYICREYFYRGGWKDGVQDGQGMIVYRNGTCHIGEWKNGRQV